MWKKVRYPYPFGVEILQGRRVVLSKELEIVGHGSLLVVGCGEVVAEPASARRKEAHSQILVPDLLRCMPSCRVGLHLRAADCGNPGTRRWPGRVEIRRI